MSHVNDLLAKRLKKKEQSSAKMVAMAQKSAEGNLTSFSGIFALGELSGTEKAAVEDILKGYGNDDDILNSRQRDLDDLLAITAEIKAINNQAAILHGERIKKAHSILTRYRDGAFTSWLIATYGNRQTPYNFWQYYEFWMAMPAVIRSIMEKMPRQAIYTLASRDVPIDRKQTFIEAYSGQTKEELLTLIREWFPLPGHDHRSEDVAGGSIKALQKLCQAMEKRSYAISTTQKKALVTLIKQLQAIVNGL